MAWELGESLVERIAFATDDDLIEAALIMGWSLDLLAERRASCRGVVRRAFQCPSYAVSKRESTSEVNVI